VDTPELLDSFSFYSKQKKKSFKVLNLSIQTPDLKVKLGAGDVPDGGLSKTSLVLAAPLLIEVSTTFEAIQ